MGPSGLPVGTGGAGRLCVQSASAAWAAPRTPPALRAQGSLLDISRATVGSSGGGGWSCRGVLSVRETGGGAVSDIGGELGTNRCRSDDTGPCPRSRSPWRVNSEGALEQIIVGGMRASGSCERRKAGEEGPGKGRGRGRCPVCGISLALHGTSVLSEAGPGRAPAAPIHDCRLQVTRWMERVSPSWCRNPCDACSWG